MLFCPKSTAYDVDLSLACNATGRLPILKELTNPCLGNSVPFGVVGNCNGLLCIAMEDFSSCLWNPSTRKHFHVPKAPIQQSDEWVTRHWGLGYDCNSDDYKVVCITCSEVWNDGSDTFVVWVYSLKSGSWKSIADFPYYLIGLRPKGVFVNGALHWLVRRNSDPNGSVVIVAFDLGKLECDLLPLPEYDPSILKPLVYTRAGNLLLWIGFRDSQVIVHYEFETKSFERISHQSSKFTCFPVVYIPSLVCPDQCAGNSCAAL